MINIAKRAMSKLSLRNKVNLTATAGWMIAVLTMTVTSPASGASLIGAAVFYGMFCGVFAFGLAKAAHPA